MEENLDPPDHYFGNKDSPPTGGEITALCRVFRSNMAKEDQGGLKEEIISKSHKSYLIASEYTAILKVLITRLIFLKALYLAQDLIKQLNAEAGCHSEFQSPNASTDI
ncbi:hypothetical protein ACTXT7_005516 [Hymenolepis weldensis]